MNRKERYRSIIEYFEENMPNPETELHFGSPFQLLVAVILSAQCTDKRVNIITPELFKRFPDAASMAAADEKEIYELIKSCTYPNSKTRHLSNMSRVLTENFGGVIPDDTEKLVTLPGVGRKTANVVASVLFRKHVMPVDTHVFRVASRIGLTINAKNPTEAERQLTKYFPGELLYKAHHWLILHGRYICVARNPKCSICGISRRCKFYEEKLKKGG